jgi:tetratricopeptide (TPR) repeat protein
MMTSVSLAAPPPTGSPLESDAGKRPTLTGQTKTRKSEVKKSATERSLLSSIDTQKQIITLEDRRSPTYPLQVIALADFYWDLAEWYGLQTSSEAIEKPLFDAEERGDTATVKKLKRKQAKLEAKKREYQEQTIEVYREVIRKFPSASRLDEIRYFLAYNLGEMGDKEGGVQIYTELIGAHPRSPFVPDAIVNIGEHYFEINDFSNALRLYQEAEKFPDSGIFGYAIYKQAWCHYNLADYPLALSKFLGVIKLAEEKALSGQKGAIALKREAQNDMVLPYSKVGKPGGAIKFLRTYAPDRYLALAGKLAGIYTEQNEFGASTKLLRALIKQARSGNIDGQDQSYMIVQFQRQIVDNALLSSDKESTVTELGELLRVWEEVRSSGAPSALVEREQDEVKRMVLDVAATYQKEYDTTKELKTLEYTQRLYDEYLRVFRTDENAYEIAMNNALLLLTTTKWEEAAAAFEGVIAMQPNGKFADDAAERAVLAYLNVIEAGKTDIKNDEREDVSKQELTPQEQRFVQAVDRWMGLVKKNGVNDETAGNIPAARFRAARVLYTKNNFDAAATRFVDFLDSHPRHSAANDARRYLLSAYNLAHDVDKLTEFANRFDKIAALPRDLRADIQKIRNELNFQRCFKPEKAKKYADAAECFRRYAQDFPESDNAPKAQYNAGINYFEAKNIEKALNTQRDLYAKYRNKHPLAPKALYAIAEIFRQTTVYDEAAKFYESFVTNHPQHELSEKALRYAAIYRQTLGQYRQSIGNLTTWLKRYGDQPSAPRVHLKIIELQEKQGKYRQVIKFAGKHLKTRAFADEPPSVRLQVLAERALAHKALRKFRKAEDAFENTVETFNMLKPNQQQDLSIEAISAVAEAHFNIGEKHLRWARAIKLTQRSTKAFSKALKDKLTHMKNAKQVYNQVIAYGHPGWQIAAWSQLGLAYEDLANAVENTPVPNNIRRLGYVAEDEFRQNASDQAKGIRDSSLKSYRAALDVARKERWFNKYSEKAEEAIARLDLADLSIKEYRLRPTLLTANSGHPTVYPIATDAGPQCVEAFKMLNDPKLMATQSGKAAALLTEFVKTTPGNAAAWYNLGLAQTQLGKKPEAAWRKAMAADPKFLPARAQLAGLQLAAGRRDAGIAELEAIIAENRFQAEARNLLAADALDRKDYDAARVHARNVLLGDARNENALLNAAISYIREGLFDQTALIATSAIERQDDAAALHNALGLVYLEKDNTRRATEHFLKALKANPENQEARLNLAALELAYGNFKSALQRFNEALTRTPNDAELVASRGVAYRGLSKFEEAKKDYNKALKLRPGYAEPQYNLCVLHHQFTNDWAEAKSNCSAFLKRISEDHPKFREVKKRVKAIDLTIKALKASQAPLETSPETPPTEPTP